MRRPPVDSRRRLRRPPDQLRCRPHHSYFLLQSATETQGAQDPFFGAGDVIFQVFSKLYVVAVVVILICSLGNRPQGSNVFFTGSMVLFGVLQIMLLYCAGWTVYNACVLWPAGLPCCARG